jgi:hypothetical protein
MLAWAKTSSTVAQSGQLEVDLLRFGHEGKMLKVQTANVGEIHQ